MNSIFEIGKNEYEQLDRLDREFAVQGVSSQSRALRVIPEFCRCHNIQYVIPSSPVVRSLHDFYEEHFSGPSLSGGGFYTGLTCFLDHAYRVDIPLVVGRVEFDLISAINIRPEQRSRIWRFEADKAEFLNSAYCAIDIGATALGFDNFSVPDGREKELFKLAAIQNQASAMVLTGGAMQYAVKQTSSLAFELSVKSLMWKFGARDDQLRTVGHRLHDGIDWLRANGFESVAELDELAQIMPNYVEDRYRLNHPGRLKLLEIATKAQRCVAICARELSAASIQDFFDVREV